MLLFVFLSSLSIIRPNKSSTRVFVETSVNSIATETYAERVQTLDIPNGGQLWKKWIFYYLQAFYFH